MSWQKRLITRSAAPAESELVISHQIVDNKIRGNFDGYRPGSKFAS
jgi:hypothetical protein